MDGQDRLQPVLGRRNELEPAVGLEGPANVLGTLRDLVGRDRDAQIRFMGHVVAQVGGRVHGFHGRHPTRSPPA